MKRIVQPNVRKVYGMNASQTQQQHSPEMNSAVRKIHNLLSSGAVTVTGPNQPRILKQKPLSAGSTIMTTTTTTQSNAQMQQVATRCYVCDELPAGSNNHLLMDMVTPHTNTKFPNKIGQVVGDTFMVIVSVEDIVCPRCTNLINYLDRLENDVERVKTNLLNLLYKKYGLNEDPATAVSSSPPVKMQKLNSGNVVQRRVISEDGVETNTRKITVQGRDSLDNQLSTIFDGDSKQSSVHQIKITTPQMAQQQQQQQKAKPTTTKMYKCMSCDFKTPDLKQIQPHYDVCKQHFQCKICKKMFANMNAMRQHMSEKHSNTEYSCSICNLHLPSEAAMKRHLETNHSSDGKQVGIVHESQAATTPLFTCNLCQFKTTEKPQYDEHMRKHSKIKPFKCRLCSMRFESREQASIHAKTHQPNYFKCGTCSASFPSRDQLVKHFETHQKPQAQQAQAVAAQQQTSQISSTQQLLQDTIDEALRDTSEGDNKGIHFFSCNECSLTFIQENYYTQHMELHKPEKAAVNVVASVVNNSPPVAVTNRVVANVVKEASVAASPSTSISEADIESIFEKMHSDKDEGMNAGQANAVVDSSSNDANKNMVITTEDNSVGITFNFTLPPNQEGVESADKEVTSKKSEQSSAPSVQLSIDMPVLDQHDESNNQTTKGSVAESAASKTEEENSQTKAQSNDETSAGPAIAVSMPSLDDDSEMQVDAGAEEEGQAEQQTEAEQEQAQQEEQQEHMQEDGAVQQGQEEEEEQHVTLTSDQVSMDLEDMQNVEGGQIKFILNENGQLLQLDNNHILTTDADGNQILVQGADQEHIQQLLQSLQSGDGLDGETLQMIGDNNQMVIVQQGDSEPQLIDASTLLNDGHIVIQQQDGEIDGETTHVIGEGGVRIPVSVAYTADGQTILQTAEPEDGDIEHKDIDGNAISGADQAQAIAQGAGGEQYFALEDLMQQSEQSKGSE